MNPNRHAVFKYYSIFALKIVASNIALRYTICKPQRKPQNIMANKKINKFTDNIIKGLQPESTRYDVTSNSLVLRVSPNGTKTFSHIFRFNGTTGLRITFGQYPFISLAEANEMLFDAQRLLAKGVDPRAHKKEAEKAAAGEINVQQLFNRYMNEYVRPALAERTIRDYEKEISKHIVDPWANMAVKSVARQDGIQLIKDMLRRGQNSESGRVKSYLSGMWKFAINHEIVDSNPFTELKNIFVEVGTKPKLVKITKRSRFLTDEEIGTSWRGINKHCEDDVGAALMLMILLGRRGEDVRKMRKSEIDLKAKIWHMTPAKVREKDKANFIPILMPLPKLAFNIIAEQIKKATEDDWMFPSPNIKCFGKHITQSALSQAVERADYFGMPRWTPHDLRRTTSTGLARIGIDQSAIDQVLAHSMKGLAKVYNRHDYLETRLAALEKWNDHVFKLITAK